MLDTRSSLRSFFPTTPRFLTAGPSRFARIRAASWTLTCLAAVCLWAALPSGAAATEPQENLIIDDIQVTYLDDTTVVIYGEATCPPGAEDAAVVFGGVLDGYSAPIGETGEFFVVIENIDAGIATATAVIGDSSSEATEIALATP